MSCGYAYSSSKMWKLLGDTAAAPKNCVAIECLDAILFYYYYYSIRCEQDFCHIILTFKKEKIIGHAVDVNTCMWIIDFFLLEDEKLIQLLHSSTKPRKYRALVAAIWLNLQVK